MKWQKEKIPDRSGYEKYMIATINSFIDFGPKSEQQEHDTVLTSVVPTKQLEADGT